MTGLKTLAEERTDFSRHRQRVLDHLLARFNEAYPHTDDATYETIANKEALLQQYRELGVHRAAAAPPPRPGEKPASAATRPLSGLEKKISLLLRRDIRMREPSLAALGRDRESNWPTDFYFVLEPIRFLPREPAAALASELTMEFPVTAFGPALYHVLLNWTYRPLTAAFCRYAENLILENAPAHLYHRFIWIETRALPRRAARPATLFLGLARAWYEAGSPPLEGRFIPGPDGALSRLQVRRRTAAARLFRWLNQPAGETPVPPVSP